MADLTIRKLSNSFLKVIPLDESMHEELYYRFRYEKPNFQKNPYSKWDGQVRLYNKKTMRLPYGLLYSVLSWAKGMGYSVDVDPAITSSAINNVTQAEIESWLANDIGLKYTPYHYQTEAIYKAIRYNRLTALLATSAGKSLIIACLARYYLELTANDGYKTLIIVPSVMLVDQMGGDFDEYFEAEHSITKYCHFLKGGVSKQFSTPILVTTWQSIQKMDAEWFEQFGRVIVDEAHGSSADKLTTIMEYCVNAGQRVALTGTLNGTEVHEMQVQSLFGSVQRIIGAKELQDNGFATKTVVNALLLNYGQEDRTAVHCLTYQDEIDFLINCPKRNRVIMALANSLTGNTLILFNRIDDHLEKVYELMMLVGTKKKVYRIHGKIDDDVRNEIKRITEIESDVVILASLGTMSTGCSIKNLHNLVFAHPTKSLIKTLQSLGRLMRLHTSKDVANIYDMIDNLETRARPNYALTHGRARVGFYRMEGHQIIPKSIVM